MQTSAWFSRKLFYSLVCVSFIVIALVATPYVCAQGYFGTVSGVLTDASGAVVQGAKVTLTDEQKGYTFATT